MECSEYFEVRGESEKEQSFSRPANHCLAGNDRALKGGMQKESCGFGSTVGVGGGRMTCQEGKGRERTGQFHEMMGPFLPFPFSSFPEMPGRGSPIPQDCSFTQLTPPGATPGR